MTTIAFYLPQFHPIPENDAWWGDGFTEWTQVCKAEPLFSGHAQPFRPASDLGHYDLRDVGVMERQFALARAHGIDAFCIYHYWFSGRRLLETPMENLLKATEIEASFCLCWANENWTRRWDGKDSEVLMSQAYGDGWIDGLFASLAPALHDPRYLRIGKRPVLVVHRADLIPDCARSVEELRSTARRAGLGELLLVAAETKYGLDPRPLGFDAVCEFPPVGANNLASGLLRPVRGLGKGFRGRLMSYPRLAKRYQRRREPPFVRFRGVMPGWDNTPRRGKASTVYLGSTPHRFGNWLEWARNRESSRPVGSPSLVFINAWNEWGEGAALEPSELHGDAYLRAVRDPALAEDLSGLPEWGAPSIAYLRSIAVLVAGSLLHALRSLRRIPSRLIRVKRSTGP